MAEIKNFKLKKYYTKTELANFATYMEDLQSEIGFKVSSRGWGYILEGRRLINKDQFDKIEELINNCRRKGFLPIDFVAEEMARQFDGIEIPDAGNVVELFGRYLNAAQSAHEYYTPDWWSGEDYYIQMVVEKVDLVTLFQPVCAEYHIPIANSKGWSSLLQRADYSRRFAEAQQMGLKCVLLYCGDHDPDGLRISDFLRKNIYDLKDIRWSDGTQGYDPEDLIIERFGLNYPFIMQNKLTWIDNLITGRGIDLGKPSHPNFKLPYVQQYLKKFRRRKVEGNSIVTIPEPARRLVRGAIEKYLGKDAKARFEAKRALVKKELEDFFKKHKVDNKIKAIHNAIKKHK